MGDFFFNGKMTPTDDDMKPYSAGSVFRNMVIPASKLSVGLRQLFDDRTPTHLASIFYLLTRTTASPSSTTTSF